MSELDYTTPKLPLVSAIMTTHNRLRLLKRAVESVKIQTYPNIELIVVDDKSDDGTREWCEKQNFNYIYIPPQDSLGGNHARNVGIIASNGDYIAFLDDDDYWLPGKIEEQLRAISIFGDSIIYNLRKFEYPDNHFELEKEYPDLEGDLKYKSLYNGGFTSTSAILVPRKSLFDVGLWDEDLKIWQDNDLIIRLAQKYDFHCLKQPFTVYRIDSFDSSKLSNKYHDWVKAVKYLRQKHKSLIRDLDIKQKQKLLAYYFREAYFKSKVAGLKYISLKYKILFSLVAPKRAIKSLFN